MKRFTSKITAEVKQFFYSSKTVVFHSRISFDDDPEAFFEKFKNSLEIAKKNGSGEIEIDLCSAEFIYPSALIFFLSLSETVDSNVRLTISVKEMSPIHEYLILSGFSRLFSVPDLPDGFRSSFKIGEVFSMESGTELSNEQEKAQWFVERLNMETEFHQQFLSRSIESMEEVFRNVKKHSLYGKWFGMGQVYPTTGNVRFVIYDNGQGIKKSLTKSPYTKKHNAFRARIDQYEYKKLKSQSANHAIQRAAEKMISSTDYVNNSGAGLDFLINEFGKAYDATVTIISQNGMVSWKSGKLVSNLALPYEIKGTIISIVAKGLKNDNK